MKSAQVHAIPFSRDYLQRPDLDPMAKRLILLPPDWALLGREDTKAKAQQYANDQNAWFDDFVSAFLKVTKQGYAEGELKPCTAAPCVIGGPGGLECGDKTRAADGRRRLLEDPNAQVSLPVCTTAAARIAAGDTCTLNHATATSATISCTPSGGGAAVTEVCSYACTGDTCESDDEADAMETSDDGCRSCAGICSHCGHSRRGRGHGYHHECSGSCGSR